MAGTIFTFFLVLIAYLHDVSTSVTDICNLIKTDFKTAKIFTSAITEIKMRIAIAKDAFNRKMSLLISKLNIDKQEEIG